MKLNFSPIRSGGRLTASVSGDVTLNGEALDFGALSKGAILPRDAIENPWIGGDVLRAADGTLHVVLFLPHGANAPQKTRFPKGISVKKGRVSLPPYEDTTLPGDGGVPD